MSTALDPPPPTSKHPGISGPLKRKRGWQTGILAFAADESSEEDEGDDDEMDEDEEDDEDDAGAPGGESGPGNSTVQGAVKKARIKEDVRPLNRDQILMREVSACLSF